MPLTTVAIDGTPIETLGLTVTPFAPVGFDGWASVPKWTYQKVQIPTRPGMRVVSSGSSTDVRTMGLSLVVSPSGQMPAAFVDRAAKLDWVLSRIGEGLHEVTTIDAPGRVSYCLVEGMQVSSRLQWFQEPSVRADIQLVANDPLWYDAEPVVTVVPAGQRKTLPVGTALTLRIVIEVLGAYTGPAVVIVRDHTGAEVQRNTLAGNLTSSELLSIDCDAGTLTKFSSGVATDVFSSTLGVTETWIRLLAGSGYTIECAQAPLVVRHYRAWWTV